MGDMMDWVLWAKALHVIAVMSWMAGLLYLPRLFVYHVDAEVGSELSETLKVMERRLLRIIMTPAMIVAWIAGLLIGYAQNLLFEPWFMVKFVAVVLLSAAHMGMAKYRRDFEVDLRLRSAKFFRIYNEVPTLLMILVVGLVVVRPF